MRNCPAQETINLVLHPLTITQLNYKRSVTILCSDASRYPCQAYTAKCLINTKSPSLNC